ncbi:MAG TPA: STAS/SEC14 domain-containing protein [Thiolapillus brandeum]|uniref:STAS/SEC14 domain-containing protein n=1 Tax=Thiolapillus brandeum TaxID=1076588 RepID=A0A831WCN1_9GAMM|nr:STAS/SEC14 domain-containing protein [Thiolapillus brandeum]
MLKIELDEESAIAVLQPEGPLTRADFEAAASRIDPYLEKHGRLRGLIIYSQDFPGWDSFGAALSHLKFIRNHHQKLSHVALVTDSRIGSLAEKLTSHFVSAEVRHFPHDQLLQAKNWILDS